MSDTTIQDRAAAALAESRKARVAREREDAARQEQEDNDLLGRLMKRRLGLTVTPAGGRVTLDGVTFTAWEERLWGETNHGLGIVIPCPNCGADVRSTDIRGWGDLGEQLECPTLDSDYHREGECTRDAVNREVEAETAPAYYVHDEAGNFVPLREALAALGYVSGGDK